MRNIYIPRPYSAGNHKTRGLAERNRIRGSFKISYARYN